MPTDAQTLIDLVATQGYEKLSRRELIECILAAAQGGSSGTPAYQDMQVAWTPTSANLGEIIGFYADGPLPGIDTIIFNGAHGFQGLTWNHVTGDITAVDFPNLLDIDPTFITANGGIVISNCATLQRLSAPICTVIGGYLALDNCPALVTFDFTSLVSCFQLSLYAIHATSISLPDFSTHQDNTIIRSSSSLTSISLPSWVPFNNEQADFSFNALSATSVNHLLARGVANPAFVSGQMDLRGGTNAAPTGQGIIDKATLVGRGVTVTTNP